MPRWGLFGFLGLRICQNLRYSNRIGLNAAWVIVNQRKNIAGNVRYRTKKYLVIT
jgi:hypothetical protein